MTRPYERMPRTKTVISRKTIARWIREDRPTLSEGEIAYLTALCINALINAGKLEPAPIPQEKED